MTKSYNLIAVDDEESVKFLFEHFFEDEIKQNKILFKFVTSGSDCLSYLEKLEGETIVLTDINMPEMSGIELLKIINKDYPSVMVYMVSAYDKLRHEKDLAGLKIVDYVSKPVDFSTLKTAIRKQFQLT